MSLEELIVSTVERAVKAAFEQHAPRAEVHPELCKLSVASERTGLSEDTLRRWIRDGRLKRYGSGRPLLVRMDELLSIRPKEDEDERRTTDDIVAGLLGGR